MGTPVQRPTRIIYIGTYEAGYPRNVLTIAALRHAGFHVEEIHHDVWRTRGDRSAVAGSPRALLGLGLRLAGAYPRLAASLVRHRREADVVAFGYTGQLDVVALGTIARLLRKPIMFDPLITLTDTLIDDRQRLRPDGAIAGLVRAIDRLALRRANLVLADTEENRGYLMGTFGVPDERCRVVPVGADERIFTPPRTTVPPGRPERFEIGEAPSTASSANPLRVLFYGTMIPLQGVDTIVRAAKLLESDGKVEVAIIGSGQVEREVKTLAGQFHARYVNFIDYVPYEELPRRIADADVLLGIFGDTEKAARVVPNKVYQAMAMGAAIITRDSPAIRRVLSDGESALLVPPADPQALAAAIIRLRDRELRHRLGAAARARFLETAALPVQAEAVREAVAGLIAGSAGASQPVTA